MATPFIQNDFNETLKSLPWELKSGSPKYNCYSRCRCIDVESRWSEPQNFECKCVFFETQEKDQTLWRTVFRLGNFSGKSELFRNPTLFKHIWTVKSIVVQHQTNQQRWLVSGAHDADSRALWTHPAVLPKMDIAEIRLFLCFTTSHAKSRTLWQLWLRKRPTITCFPLALQENTHNQMCSPFTPMHWHWDKAESYCMVS